MLVSHLVLLLLLLNQGLLQAHGPIVERAGSLA